MSVNHDKAQLFLSELTHTYPKLPFEPSLLPELFTQTSTYSLASLEYIVTLVNNSQGLASHVLRLANSAYYGLQSGVSSLSQAIKLLGLNEIRGLILALGISGALKGLAFPEGFSLRTILEHQVLTATIAENLGMAVASLPGQEGLMSPDELYAAGLLHDIGKVLTAAYCPREWEEIQALALSKQLCFYQAEHEYWGIDHSVAGARLLSYWKIPARLTEPVNWHHNPDLALENMRPSVHILAAANILAGKLPRALKDGALPLEVQVHLPAGLDTQALLDQICESTLSGPGIALISGLD